MDCNLAPSPWGYCPQSLPVGLRATCQEVISAPHSFLSQGPARAPQDYQDPVALPA